MNILVPTDFSELSEVALAEAIAWAEARDGKLQLLHVSDTPFWPVPEDWPESEVAGLHDELTGDAVRRLRETQSLRIGTALASEVHVAQGTPHLEIARFAAEKKAHLIVMATHGHSWLKRFLLGSTTERIVRSSPCPVLIVRQRGSSHDSDRRGVVGLRRILVATDFSAPSIAAIDTAIDLAGPRDAEIVLFHALRDADYPTRQALSRRLWSETRRRCERRLDRLRTDRIGESVRSRTLLREGVPSAQIADAASENDADLIVLGSHGNSGVTTFLLGSTAERVVRIAPCSVYVSKDDAAGRVEPAPRTRG